TRWGGIFIMDFVPINDRVQQFINAMSGSVLIALLTPLAINGDMGAKLALIATAITMLVLKKPLIAIAAGIVVAALVRQF
ncbi:MAG: putative membrane protein, partial [Marinobacter psychrophilus]